MPAAVRVGDTTIDQDNENNGPDTGKVIIGSPNVFINEGWGQPENTDVTGTALEQSNPDKDLVANPKATNAVPEECAEGYIRRQPGNIDPVAAGLEEPLKIRNVTIPIDCKRNINVQFILNDGTDEKPRPAKIIWQLKTKGDLQASTPDSTFPSTLQFNAQTGLLSGTLDEGQYEFVVTVTDDSNTIIDSKRYKVLSKECDGTEIIMTHPMPGARLTSKYGSRVHPVHGGKKMHWGVDYALGGKGTIVAAADGVVLWVGEPSGYGAYIAIGHYDGNGKQVCVTGYAHWRKALVTQGQQISAGTPIALEGNRGVGSGAHLHFEVCPPTFCKGVGSKPQFRIVRPVDPLPYINGSKKVVQSVAVSETIPIVKQTSTNTKETPIPVDSEKQNASIEQIGKECPASSGGPYATDQAYRSYLAGLDKKYGLPNGMLYAVMMVESRGRPGLVSGTGAIGLFQQLGPFRADPRGGRGMSREDSLNAYKSADAAANYLSNMYKRNGGDIYYTFSGYNWGPGAANDVRKNGGKNSPRYKRMADPRTGPDRVYAEKCMAFMPNGCNISIGPGIAASDNVGGAGEVPLTIESMENRCSEYNPPMTETVNPNDPGVSASGGDENSTEPAISANRTGHGSNPPNVPEPMQKKETLKNVNKHLNDPTNPITSTMDDSAKNLIKFQGKVNGNYDPFSKDPDSGGIGIFGIAPETMSKYMVVASTVLAATGHPTAAVFGGIIAGTLPQITEKVENLLNYGVSVLTPGIVPDVGKIVEVQTLAYGQYLKENILAPYDEFKNTAGATINGLTVVSNEFTDRYKNISKEAFCTMMQFEGMDNIRAGNDTGGLQFFNENYGK